MEYQTLGDKDLAAACSRGDRSAERELYTRYAARLYLVCQRYVSDREDARDLMHDALIKALDSIGKYSFTGEGSLYSWLRRVTVNMAIDRLRRQKLKFVPLPDYAVLDVPDDDVKMLEIPKEVLLKMVQDLPEERRAVFNMYCIDGFSHKQIAEVLGINEKSSASVLARARIQLRQAVNDYMNKDE